MKNLGITTLHAFDVRTTIPPEFLPCIIMFYISIWPFKNVKYMKITVMNFIKFIFNWP